MTKAERQKEWETNIETADRVLKKWCATYIKKNKNKTISLFSAIDS
jgi:hypothetical protein